MAMGKIKIAAAAVAVAGAAVFGGSALANAATGSTTSASPASTYGAGAAGGSTDTPVTGDELAKVTAAVKAKDSSVTVTKVQKDPDGSYDVFGTKAGSRLMFEVSADLGTITQNTSGPRQGNGTPSTSSSSTT